MSDTQLFALEGVACGGCISALQEAFDNSGLDVKAEFSLEQKTVTVTGEVAADTVIGLIRTAGYGATLLAE